jgi:hypothetical protein
VASPHDTVKTPLIAGRENAAGDMRERGKTILRKGATIRQSSYMSFMRLTWFPARPGVAACFLPGAIHG